MKSAARKAFWRFPSNNALAMAPHPPFSLFPLPFYFRKNPGCVIASGILSGASRTRTYDPIDVNDVLYRLSHGTMSLDDMGYDTTVRDVCQPLN